MGKKPTARWFSTVKKVFKSSSSSSFKDFTSPEFHNKVWVFISRLPTITSKTLTAFLGLHILNLGICVFKVYSLFLSSLHFCALLFAPTKRERNFLLDEHDSPQ